MFKERFDIPRKNKVDKPVLKAKKRHHYVPITYLNGFTDDGGRLNVFRCDDVGATLSLVPNNIAFQNYYYSQPTPEGGRDDHRFEDIFDAEVETHWLEARQAARDGALTPHVWSRLYLMLASLRARVPATREMIETSLAASVRMTLDHLDRQGDLPTVPAGLEDIWSKVEISIDPHQSLHAIPGILQSVNLVQEEIGFEILHNRTSRPFITSDNPVAWFDPRTPEGARKPYKLDRLDMRAELIFPIDSWTLLRGTNALKRRHSGRLTSRILRDEDAIRRMNRITAQFAYRLMFARDDTSLRLMRHFASLSPVLRTGARPVEGGDLLWMDMELGRRPTLPKWKIEAS